MLNTWEHHTHKCSPGRRPKPIWPAGGTAGGGEAAAGKRQRPFSATSHSRSLSLTHSGAPLCLLYFHILILLPFQPTFYPFQPTNPFPPGGRNLFARRPARPAAEKRRRSWGDMLVHLTGCALALRSPPAPAAGQILICPAAGTAGGGEAAAQLGRYASISSRLRARFPLATCPGRRSNID